MPSYRATIRYGEPQTYEMVDVRAADLRAALREVEAAFPEAAVATADLVEIRRMVSPDEREYGPG